MANVSQWSTTAASNNSAPPDGAPEGMAPSAVNNIMRENMAALAKWYQDTEGSLVSAGSGNTFTLTTNNVHASLADQSLQLFRADHANTGAATLTVDGLTAKSIKYPDGTALSANDITTNQMVIVAYNATNDDYRLLSQANAASATARGVVELATDAEAEAEAATDKALVASNLAGIGVWKDSRYFESAEQTPATSNLYTIAHGLGVAPKFVELVAVCKTAEGGYAVNDILHMGSYFNLWDGSAEHRIPVLSDATNVRFKTSSALQFPRFDTTSHFTMTPANWKFKVRAFA